MEHELYMKIREFVRQEQERRGRDNPVRMDEISEEFGIPEGDLYEQLAGEVRNGHISDMDLFITFND